jgi:hypothetical protein
MGKVSRIVSAKPLSKHWRENYRGSLLDLLNLPEGINSWSASRPTAQTIESALALGEAISRPDMPIPSVAAGSDGSIEVTWRRNPDTELSCFVEPAGITVLLMRDGKMKESGLFETREIAQFVREFFE